jgi:hypothetical protein
LGEQRFSFSTVRLAACSADEARSLSDNPLAAALIEIARRLLSSWHSLTMSRIAPAG